MLKKKCSSKKNVRNAEMILLIYAKLINSHTLVTSVPPLDKVHLLFYGQESFTLLSVFYDLKSCKIAQMQWNQRLLYDQAPSKYHGWYLLFLSKDTQ